MNALHDYFVCSRTRWSVSLHWLCFSLLTLPSWADAHYVNVSNATPEAPYTTWDTAAANIQDVIDIPETTAGDIIWVKPGVYDVNGRSSAGQSITNRLTIDKPVTVRSFNGPTNTIIVGRGPISTIAIRCVYLGSNATLSGFTLMNGCTRGSYDNSGSGGGVFCESESSIVTNCVVTDNRAFQCGGGIYQGTVWNCIISNNYSESDGGGVCKTKIYHSLVITNEAHSAGGGTYTGYLENCSIIKNTANSGGGVYDATLIQCLISNNSAFIGGGVDQGLLIQCTNTDNTATFWGGGAFLATLKGCTLEGNSAMIGGGGIFSTFRDCIIKNNVADEGGGSYGGNLINCIIMGNRADDGGGVHGAYVGNSIIISNSASASGGGVYGGTIINSILYYNEGENWEDVETTDPLLTLNMKHCCTTPIFSNSVSCITNKPHFMDLNKGDFRMTISSPCIDAGINEEWMVKPTHLTENSLTTIYFPFDYIGSPRVMNGTVDIGAYEFGFSTDIKVMLEGAAR